MVWLSERFSGYFRRSLGALQATPGSSADGPEHLAALVGAPVTAAVLAGLIDRELAHARDRLGLRIDPDAAGEAVAQALRRARRLLLMALAERDIRGEAPLEEICGAMSAFAAQVTGIALAQAGAELQARHGLVRDSRGLPQDLLAVAMGKGGAGELNVSSDLDLVFVFREQGESDGLPGEDGRPQPGSRLAASEFMHRLARRAIGLLSENTAEGFVFRVDTRLRPNGDSGPLVASLQMLEDYFFDQGREWERFAWLKGVVIADSGLADAGARAQDTRALESIVTPFVFRRYLDFRAFHALRELHVMIRAEVTRRDRRDAGSLDVKLGRGGIREVEFIAQLFQIVRGGRDHGLRDRRTLSTLASLGERGVLQESDAAGLAEAYRLLRRAEHALQYREDAQTHRLPSDPGERAVIAQMLGMAPADFEDRLERARTHVQRVFDDLLRDGTPGAAAAPAPELTEALDASVRARMDSLRGSTRLRAAREDTRAAVENLLARAVAARVSPEVHGRFMDLIEKVLGRPAYLALLSQFPQAQERVMRLLGQSRWAADYLLQHPIVLDELLDGQLLDAPEFALWERTLRDALSALPAGDGPDVEREMDLVREAHHAQLFRLLVQDLEGLHTVERLSDHLSELADRVLSVALDRVWPLIRKRHREQPRFAVIAYGRLGGKELGYASDLDLVFLYDDPDDRAPEAYAQFSQRLATWMSSRTAAGLLFEIDLRLRPNGNAGMLVSSLKGFIAYQEESAWVWEHQALTRARFAAGDPGIGARFEAERRQLLARPRDRAGLRDEVIAMRRKMHEGHPNRSALFDLKHDSGGMVDIEFIVQFLVLAHAHEHPELLDNAGNIALLGRAAAAGLIDATLAAQVADAYRHFRKLQHGLRLNDAQYARVDPVEVAGQRAAVTRLREAVFG